MKFKHILIPYTRINSKWLKDLNIRHDTLKLLEDVIGKTISDTNRTNVSLVSLQGNRNKSKTKQMGPNQTHKLLHSREMMNKTKRQPMGWEKISANSVTDKGLVSKIYTHLTQLNNKTQKTQ